MQDRRRGETYADDGAELNQPRQFSAFRTPPPEHTSFLISSHIDCSERDLVGFQNGLEPRRGGDDVRRACCKRSVEVESGVSGVGFRGGIRHFQSEAVTNPSTVKNPKARVF
jgi:hypothetical protein